MTKNTLTRRDFLRRAAMTGAGAALAGWAPQVLAGRNMASARRQDVITVRWMNWWGGEREPLMDEVIARFESLNPNIHIDNQVQPFDNREQLAATALASQDPPSLIMVSRVEALKYASDGLIIPIDSYIEASGMKPEEVFFASELSNIRWDDHIWSFPLPTGGGVSSVWWYNKNVLREVGLDPEKPPVTWQDVEAIVAATTVIKDGVIEKIGVSGLDSYRFPALLYCNNGKYYSDDGKQILFNSPEAVETLEWMTHIVNDYCGGIDAYNAFFQGKEDSQWTFFQDTLALWYNDTGSLGWFEQRAPEMYADPDQWGISLTPYNSNNANAKATGVSGLYFAWNQVIPAGLSQEARDAAYKWLEFFTTNRDGGCWFLEQQHRPSPVIACTADPEYSAGIPYWDKILESFDIDVSVPVSPVHGQISDILTQATDEVFFGMRSAQDALDFAYQQAQPILDQFWSTR